MSKLSFPGSIRSNILSGLFFLLLTVPVFLAGQQPPAPWGKVAPRDLLPGPGPGPEAVVLFDYGHLTFQTGGEQVQYTLERHRRLKIFREEAFDRGTITIPVYTETESIRRLQAQVILPTGETVRLRRRDIKEERVSDFFSQYTFTFPGLVEGAVVEYRYTRYSTLVEELPGWFFQEDIPVRWSEYFLEIPAWYQYVEVKQGPPPAVNDSTLIEDPSFFNVRPSTLVRRIVYREVPAMPEAPLITTMSDYRAGIRFFLAATNFGGSKQALLSSWETINEELLRAEDFGRLYTEQKNYDRALSSINSRIAANGSPAQKLDSLYRFLADNIRWDGNYGIFPGASPDRCFARRSGSRAEINFLLIALLRGLDIPAWPVLVSTRQNGRPITEHPLLSQFNYLIVLARLEDQFLFLDLGTPDRPPGYPAIEALNDAGFLLHPTNSQWIDLRAPLTRSSLTATLRLDTAGTLSGTLENRYTGYQAYFLREDLRESGPKAVFQEGIRQYYPDGEVGEIKIDSTAFPATAVEAQMEVILPETAGRTDSSLSFFPVLFPQWAENPLLAPDRNFPVDFPYPFLEEQLLKLELPPGYELEALPEDLEMEIPNEGGYLKFYLITARESRQLQMIFRFRMDQTRFPPDNYEEIKALFDGLMKKQNSRIVLRKI